MQKDEVSGFFSRVTGSNSDFLSKEYIEAAAEEAVNYIVGQSSESQAIRMCKDNCIYLY